jgi:CRISPR-associated protein Csm3
MDRQVNLSGRVIITGAIVALTGLHVGKGKEGVSIGGVDNPVMRDPLSNEPYIPGSSLKGKLRSLAEKREPGLAINFPPGSEVQIHVCDREAAYGSCPVCRVYGVPGDKKFATPTRLVVRDIRLAEASKDRLREAGTDLPFTEVKYEAAIDRVTSAANPRPLERVPAGTEFGPFEIIFSIYEAGDAALLPKLFEAMRLLEDDYLGGAGSRGSGKVAFKELEVTMKPVAAYADPGIELKSVSAPDLGALLRRTTEIAALVDSQVLSLSVQREAGDG